MGSDIFLRSHPTYYTEIKTDKIEKTRIMFKEFFDKIYDKEINFLGINFVIYFMYYRDKSEVVIRVAKCARIMHFHYILVASSEI